METLLQILNWIYGIVSVLSNLQFSCFLVDFLLLYTCVLEGMGFKETRGL